MDARSFFCPHFCSIPRLQSVGFCSTNQRAFFSLVDVEFLSGIVYGATVKNMQIFSRFSDEIMPDWVCVWREGGSSTSLVKNRR